jgi:hypothetical protein
LAGAGGAGGAKLTGVAGAGEGTSGWGTMPGGLFGFGRWDLGWGRLAGLATALVLFGTVGLVGRFRGFDFAIAKSYTGALSPNEKKVEKYRCS